jgi:hypothetical protein
LATLPHQCSMVFITQTVGSTIPSLSTKSGKPLTTSKRQCAGH